MTVASDGTVVTTVRDADLALFTWQADKPPEHGTASDGWPESEHLSVRLELGAPGGWSAEAPLYVIRRHAVPTGEVNLRVRREAAWYREPETPDEMAYGNTHFSKFYDLVVDHQAGLIWTLHSVPAADAPEGPPPAVGSPVEALTTVDRHRDNLIEVISIDGRLIASRWFRDTSSVPVPIPITPELWYVTNDDLLRSVTILTPELVEGG